MLPTLGGQTALNLAIELHDAGVLDEFDAELIGASVEAIHTAEDRSRFKAAMLEIGLGVLQSQIVTWTSACRKVRVRGHRARSSRQGARLPADLPAELHPGREGTGVAHDEDELRPIAEHGLAASPVGEILLEQSVVGWKEYELEVMRDHADNVVVICSIENFDPMGVHTGDSITVAPAQTLTDVDYQRMRDAAFACIRRIGVDTGGSNVQFAVNPGDGEMVIIEMNPRVSRSSALASKATGFPIAKIAAKLAVGYRLDEVTNDITRVTPASFEPTIDYVVTKIPRWAFEKLPGASPVLGTMMQSVGEAMAIGRTFPESLQKCLRSLETGYPGLTPDLASLGAVGAPVAGIETEELVRRSAVPTPERIFVVAAALDRGVTVERLHEITGIDPWFLDQMQMILEERTRLQGLGGADALTRGRLAAGEAARLRRRAARHALGRRPGRGPRRPDRGRRRRRRTRRSTRARPSSRRRPRTTTPPTRTRTRWRRPRGPTVVILGSGPNRIGQGVEFDYCCVHAAFALSEAGYETVMVNCNPETVSTDYDTSDRLFFEPLTPRESATSATR